MIKQIIEAVKVKAIEDDNIYWMKQDDLIKRKDVSIRDVKTSTLFIFASFNILLFVILVRIFLL